MRLRLQGVHEVIACVSASPLGLHANRPIATYPLSGQPFYDPVADAALCESLAEHLSPTVPLKRLDANINDAVFAEACARALVDNIRSHESSAD